MKVNLLFFVFLALFFHIAICEILAKEIQNAAYPEDVMSRDVSSRIIAGYDANAGQIPHQIHLRMIQPDGRTSACGGSVIHHEWILTAAHCLGGQVAFTVRFGALNVTRPYWMIDASNRYIHPNYDEFSNSVQTDDIGLLRLDYYIPYQSLIKPVRIQSSEQRNIDYTGVVFTASGYGLTRNQLDGGQVSQVLQWVNLRGISNEECYEWYPYSFMSNVTLCAEFYNETAQSTCSGDSGGPLTVIDEDGNPTVIGVVSFVSSVGCNSSFPSGYVRPGFYHDWITEVTGINFDWTFETIDDSFDNLIVDPSKVGTLRPRAQLQGGSIPLLGEYPGVVHLRMSHYNRNGEVTTCAGSLIHNRWVLSSAECLESARMIALRFAAINVPNPELVTESSTKHIHPEWNNVTKINDIALVTVNFIENSDNIQPITLAVGNYKVPSSGKLCSWGQNEANEPGDLLYCLDMTLKEQNDGTIIGYSTQGETTEFDLGAPLITNKGYLIGVLSKWPSGEDDFAAVFVQPRNFMPFISTTTNLVFPDTIEVSGANCININQLLFITLALLIVVFQN